MVVEQTDFFSAVEAELEFTKHQNRRIPMMNKNDIKAAISTISNLLATNPELLQQQKTLLKELAPNLDEAALDTILEKTKSKRFAPENLTAEIEALVATLK
jgi:hypothetical protein